MSRMSKLAPPSLLPQIYVAFVAMGMKVGVREGMEAEPRAAAVRSLRQPVFLPLTVDVSH